MLKAKLKTFVSRLKNPQVASACLSGILMILVNTNIINAHMSNSILTGFNTVLSIVVGLGIFANPETKKIVEKEVVQQAEELVTKVAETQTLTQPTTPVQPVVPTQPTNNNQTK